MGWETELFAFLDDLEGQAQSMWEADRDAELVDRAASEYSSVTLASRLVASLGMEMELRLPGVGRVRGDLVRAAADWCLLEGPGQEWIVALHHVQSVSGASPRSVPEVAWSPLQRLGLRSALRRLADTGDRCVIHLADGAIADGLVRRVGADFVEVAALAGEELLVPLAALVAVQHREE